MKKSLYDLTVEEFTLSILYNTECGEYAQVPYSQTETIEYLNRVTHGFNPLFVQAVYGDMRDAKLTYEMNHFDRLSDWWRDRGMGIPTTDIGGKDVCVYMDSEDGIIKDVETGEECEWLMKKFGYDLRLKMPSEPKNLNLSPLEAYVIRQRILYKQIFDDILSEHLFIYLSPLYDLSMTTLERAGADAPPCVAGSAHPSATDNVETSTLLPPVLDTERARKYFAKAVELGLMREDYKWLKTQSLLACFVHDMSIKLDLGKGRNSDGTSRVNWKLFETLFGIKKGKLRSSFNDIQKTGQSPLDSDLLKQI